MFLDALEKLAGTHRSQVKPDALMTVAAGQPDRSKIQSKEECSPKNSQAPEIALETAGMNFIHEPGAVRLGIDIAKQFILAHYSLTFVLFKSEIIQFRRIGAGSNF